MPELFVPKYHTGETVQANGKGEGLGFEGELAIIIGLRSVIEKYNGVFGHRDSSDERDAEHTYYSTYAPERNQFWWYCESDLELYCSNTERGKRVLREIPNIRFHSIEYYRFTDEAFYNFNQELKLGLIEHPSVRGEVPPH